MTIVNPLPITLTNGTLADAVQVMTDLNSIVSNVNANAAQLTGGNAFIGTQTIGGDQIATQSVLAASGGSALVGFIQSGAGASNRTAQSKLRETVSVRDFGAVGNGVTDDTTAIVNAIASLPSTGGNLIVLDRHAISSRIDITKPIHIIGNEQGNSYQPVQPPNTEFVWIGGVSAGAMIRFGLYGTGVVPLWGGGLERVRMNGGGQCAHGLEIADASMGVYREVSCYNVTASGLHIITDGTKTGMPTAWNSFYKCFMDMRAALAAGANAHGVLIEAVNGSNAGVTLHYFEDLKVNHSGGDGVRWNKGGDGFVFIKPQFFRADSETGYSCNFSSTDATDICNHAQFYYPLASAGMFFAAPGLHQGTNIHCYDSQNLNTGITELVSGPGAPEVSGFSSFGQKFGLSRLLSTFDVLVDDSMSIVRWDGTNNVLITNAGNWTVAGSGSVLIAKNSAGSAVTIPTIASLNDSTLVTHSSALNGVSTAQWPSMVFGIKIETTTSVKVRWGLFNSNADPAGDGIWVEFDPTLSSGKYRLVCSRAAVQTVLDNSSGLTGTGNTTLRWRIDVQPGRASFYAASPGAPNPQLWTYQGTITTQVPITTTAMACGVYVKTTSGSAASVTCGHIKLSQRLEYI